MNYAEKLIDAIHEAVKRGFTVQISVNDAMKFVTGWSDILYKITNKYTGKQYGFCIPETWLATEEDKGITECVLFIDAMDKMKAAIGDKAHITEEMVKDTLTTPGDYKQ